MVLPVTNDIQAQNAARFIKLFRDRLRIVDAERACLKAMVEELTEVLLAYRRGARQAAEIDAAQEEAASDD